MLESYKAIHSGIGSIFTAKEGDFSLGVINFRIAEMDELIVQVETKIKEICIWIQAAYPEKVTDLLTEEELMDKETEIKELEKAKETRSIYIQSREKYISDLGDLMITLMTAGRQLDGMGES